MLPTSTLNSSAIDRQLPLLSRTSLSTMHERNSRELLLASQRHSSKRMSAKSLLLAAAKQQSMVSLDGGSSKGGDIVDARQSGSPRPLLQQSSERRMNNSSKSPQQRKTVDEKLQDLDDLSRQLRHRQQHLLSGGSRPKQDIVLSGHRNESARSLLLQKKQELDELSPVKRKGRRSSMHAASTSTSPSKMIQYSPNKRSDKMTQKSSSRRQLIKSSPSESRRKLMSKDKSGHSVRKSPRKQSQKEIDLSTPSPRAPPKDIVLTGRSSTPTSRSSRKQRSAAMHKQTSVASLPAAPPLTSPKAQTPRRSSMTNSSRNTSRRSTSNRRLSAGSRSSRHSRRASQEEAEPENEEDELLIALAPSSSRKMRRNKKQSKSHTVSPTATGLTVEEILWAVQKSAETCEPVCLPLKTKGQHDDRAKTVSISSEMIQTNAHQAPQMSISCTVHDDDVSSSSAEAKSQAALSQLEDDTISDDDVSAAATELRAPSFELPHTSLIDDAASCSVKRATVTTTTASTRLTPQQKQRETVRETIREAMEKTNSSRHSRKVILEERSHQSRRLSVDCTEDNMIPGNSLHSEMMQECSVASSKLCRPVMKEIEILPSAAEPQQDPLGNGSHHLSKSGKRKKKQRHVISGGKVDKDTLPKRPMGPKQRSLLFRLRQRGGGQPLDHEAFASDTSSPTNKMNENIDHLDATKSPQLKQPIRQESIKNFFKRLGTSRRSLFKTSKRSLNAASRHSKKNANLKSEDNHEFLSTSRHSKGDASPRTFTDHIDETELYDYDEGTDDSATTVKEDVVAQRKKREGTNEEDPRRLSWDDFGASKDFLDANWEDELSESSFVPPSFIVIFPDDDMADDLTPTTAASSGSFTAPSMGVPLGLDGCLTAELTFLTEDEERQHIAAAFGVVVD